MSNLTVVDYRAWKGVDSSLTNEHIQAAIDGAEEAIDDHCGRRFFVASSSSARLYVPHCGSVLRVHDCTAVAAVTQSGSAISSTAYQLEPVGMLTVAGDVSPYTQIRLLGGGDWGDSYGEATVSVTGTWGWTALPARYTEATKILTADLLDNRDVRNGVIGFTEYAGVRVKANPVVSSLLRRLQRSERWGVA